MKALALLLSSLAACDGLTSIGPMGPHDDDDAVDGGAPDAAPLTCDRGRSYQGVAGNELVAGRDAQEAGVARARVKFYGAMAGGNGHPSDLAAVLGLASRPAVLTTMGPVLSEATIRWYQEPRPGGISVYATYRAAYQGCSNLTSSGATWASPPDAQSATTRCAAWQTAFWRRIPTQAETDACVELAVTQLADVSDARERWATTCASVLTAAGFITY